MSTTTTAPPKDLAATARELALDAAKGKFLDTVNSESQPALTGFSGQQKTYEQRYEDLLARWKQQEDAVGDLRQEIVAQFSDWEALLCDTVCKTKGEIARAEASLQARSQTIEVAAQGKIATQDKKRQAAKDRFTSWSKPAESLEKALTGTATEIQQVKALLARPEKVFAVYRFFVRLQPGLYAVAPAKAWEHYQKGEDDAGIKVPGKAPWESDQPPSGGPGRKLVEHGC